MKIAIIGNSYFGNILTEQLNKYDTNNEYLFYNTSENKIDKIKFFFNLPFIHTVYSVSASISEGGALQMAMRFRKKIVQHFIGSDVLTAVEDFKNSRVNNELVEASKFLCEVDWIKSELADISIEAGVASIAIYDKEIKPKEFEKFTVLTYMSQGKEKFYGMEDYIKLAKAFKDVEFRIAGITSYGEVLPENIKLLGWVNMDDEFQANTCYIRNAKHDGLAFSILEALGYGRIVLYNYNFPHAYYFESSDELIRKVSELKEDFESGKLGVNYEAIEYIKTQYSKEKVLGNLVKILTEPKK